MKTKFSTASLLGLALAACGVKTVEPDRKPLAPPPPAEAAGGAKPNKTNGSGSPGEQGSLESACVVWDELSAQAGLSDGTYQLVAELSLNKVGEKNVFFGRHIPARLPQLLYFVSAEAARDLELSEGPSSIEALKKAKAKAAGLSEEKQKLEVERKEISKKLANPFLALAERKKLNARADVLDERIEKIGDVELPKADEQATELRFRVAGYGRKKVDPISVEEFLWIAERLYRQKEVDTYQWGALKGLSFVTGINVPQLKTLSVKELARQRNLAFTRKVEESLPGVFTAKAGDLTGSALVGAFLVSVGSPAADAATLEELRPLEREVSLFPSEIWSDRARDMERVMAVLEQDESSWSIKERACRFGLQTRLTAQLLSLKGFAGRPETNERGLLPMPLNEDKAMLPEKLEQGVYGMPVTNEWIALQLKSPSSRARGTEETGPFLDALNYLVTIASRRTSRIWDDGSAGSAGRSPVALLRMSHGLLGLKVQILAKEELQASIQGVHLPRADSADNLARLVRLVRVSLKTFRPLAEPTDFDKALLSEEQRASFAGEEGLTERFASLQQALILEGLRRDRAGAASRDLLEELRLTGEEIGNDYLKSLH